jgi:phosphoribosyl-dephospho-CoA transferase
MAVARLLGLGEPRVFGALLWQHLTGMSYLTSTSDLDLLWPVAARSLADQLLRDLAEIDAGGTPRLDVEIELPDGAAVKWRELSRAQGSVLVKTLDCVEMRPVAGLFSG